MPIQKKHKHKKNINMKTFKKLINALYLFAFIGILFSPVPEAAAAFVGLSSIMGTPRMQEIKKTFMQMPQFKDAIVMDGALRIEQVLTTGNSAYTFDVLNGNTATGFKEIEQRLDQNDVFVMTHLGIYIYEQVIAEKGRGIFQTFPSTGGFGTVTAANVPDLELVYNGKFDYKVGSTVYIPEFPVKLCRWAPVQQAGEVTAAIAGPVTYTKGYSEDMYGRGHHALSSPVQISGQASNVITLSLPVFSGAVLTHNDAAYNNVVVFNPFGFVFKNCARRK